MAIHKTNPYCNIVIKRLHLYYDMKLVTFGIDRDLSLIIQFPVLIQPYAAAADTVSERNSTSSHCRSK